MARSALAPIIVFFHGGWWKSEYDLGYTSHLCAALKQSGIACWSVEYRRIGVTGGGWPTTFEDAASGLDHVGELATRFPLDLSRLLLMGHSAGAHLAFWNAGRHHVQPGHLPSIEQGKLRAAGLIALGGAVDLRLTIELSGSSTFAHARQEVFRLMGGQPADVPDRYQAGNPGDLLPFQSPQLLIQGTVDDQIPPDLPARWIAMSRLRGDQAAMQVLPGADHFDVVDPESSSWQAVLRSIKSMLKKPAVGLSTSPTTL